MLQWPESTLTTGRVSRFCWSHRWARQGSNLRPLGCKASRRHLTEPLAATTATHSASPSLRNHPDRQDFVSHEVSCRLAPLFLAGQRASLLGLSSAGFRQPRNLG